MPTPQTLILRIASPQVVPAGIRAHMEFEGRGGSIGRSEDCDWVLASPGVSRTHAIVRYVNGMFFVEDRSTNGMLLNGAPMTRGEPAALGNGDRLRLDSFDIEVAVQAAAVPPPAAAPVAGGLPDFTLLPARAQTLPPPAAPAPAPAFAQAAPLVDDLLAGLGGTGRGELDPLRLLDEAPRPPAPPPTDARGWNHSAASADHFQPPRPAASPVHLPEEWDLTSGDFARAAASPPAPPQQAAALAPAAARSAAADPELQRIFAIVVDGVMEVLRARAEIKNTFRLPVTLIQRSENNPLKFAATPDEAMQKIMAPGGAAFLSGAAAFEDAFDDIRCHQMAMLAGMRAAFESVLFHFNPDRLEQEVDASGKRSMFSGGGRYWERYRENFAATVKDPDECFRRLFGDEFARAYEAQLGRLKSARRAQAR
ncbi:type VI secretion system-associated FHA domain protein TagH [Coralloluteibacterium thermophilus]|uniref:Type VI secretion system-associated FHA domain protein TagH n=1 Tax=Coralloluteibacterium thermophilum TaxID=2707049 RepID=A0ABV9NRJ0_9GAMM